MSCYRPIQAYRIPFSQTKNGKSVVLFKVGQLVEGDYEILVLPCGRCIGCRMDRAKQWAVRCLHESFMHDRNCFLTLTYNSDNCPSDGSLKIEDVQLFLKRLRWKLKSRVRFFASGEYGESLMRPHYHLLLFGFDFPDKVLLRKSGSGNYYVSEFLADLWPFGYHIIAGLEFCTAYYVAQYAAKKLRKDSVDRYDGRKPEYIHMSLKPGIGAGFFDKYKLDLYPLDRAVIDDKHVYSVPRYYDKLLEREDSEMLSVVKSNRQSYMRQKCLDMSGKNLYDREVSDFLKYGSKSRVYDGVSMYGNCDKPLDKYYSKLYPDFKSIVDNNSLYESALADGSLKDRYDFVNTYLGGVDVCDKSWVNKSLCFSDVKFS